MAEPDWLQKAIAEGRATVRETNPAALGPPAAPPATLANEWSEAEFQQAVIGYAHERGWRVAHFRKVRVQRKGGATYWETPVAADGKGFLDLELVRDRLVKAELKVTKGRLKPEQKDWIAAYAKARVEHYVWYPADWPTIVEVLK